MFSITLSRKVDAERGTFDTTAAALEPMDYVEISINGVLVMRGFIGTVSESIGITPDGQPRKLVTVAGHDMGKVAQLMTICARANYAGPGGTAWLTTYPLNYRIGFTLERVPAQRWIREQMVDTFLNSYLRP